MTSETQEIVHVADFELPDANIVQAETQKIAAFQQLVHTHLKQDHDYGVIPGTRGKPTLLKPGAEKICSLVGLSPRFDVVGKTEDWDKGLFVYEVKCSLVSIKTDQVIAEGLGECNSWETKYRYRWIEGIRELNENPANERNTILKMAKKRSHVDAALNVAALSNLFTQDVEDMQRQSQSQAPRQPRPTNGNGQSIICPSGEKIGLKRDGTPFDMCYKCSQMPAADRPGPCNGSPSQPRPASPTPPDGYDDSAFEAMEMME